MNTDNIQARFSSKFSRTLRLGVPLAACLLGACATFNGPQQHADQSRDGLMEFADAAAQSGNPTLAVYGYNKILEHNGDDVEALTALGAVLIDSHELPEAITVLERAVTLQAEAAQEHHHHHKLVHGKRDPEQLLGRAYLKAHRPQMAEQYFLQCLEHAPGDFDASMGLAISQDFQGRHQEAQRIYDELLAQHGDHVKLRVNYGASLVFTGNAERAIEVLAPVARRPDAPLQARTNLALAYAVLGDMESADRAGFDRLSPTERRESLAFLEWAKAKEVSRCHHALSAQGDAQLHHFDCRKHIFGNVK